MSVVGSPEGLEGGVVGACRHPSADGEQKQVVLGPGDGTRWWARGVVRLGKVVAGQGIPPHSQDLLELWARHVTDTLIQTL